MECKQNKSERTLIPNSCPIEPNHNLFYDYHTFPTMIAKTVQNSANVLPQQAAVAAVAAVCFNAH